MHNRQTENDIVFFVNNAADEGELFLSPTNYPLVYLFNGILERQKKIYRTLKLHLKINVR